MTDLSDHFTGMYQLLQWGHIAHSSEKPKNLISGSENGGCTPQLWHLLQRTWCWFRSLGMQIRKRILAGLRECFRSLVKNWDISHIYIYIWIYIYIYIYCMYVYIYAYPPTHTIYIYSDEGVYLLTYWDEHPSNIVTTLTIKSTCK